MREPDRIIRLKTVLARTGLSRSTIYRKIAEGTFPAQLKISTNGTGWHESDINRWIADPAGVRNASLMRSGEPWTGTADSSCETLLLLSISGGFADGLEEETSKRRLPRVAVKGVGGLLEFDPVEQAVNVTGDRVRRHDQRDIKRMNVLARNRSLRMTDKGRNGNLGEPEIVRDACEAVTPMSLAT